MQIALEPTEKVVVINGAPCRLWLGATDEGTPVHCYVAAISPQTLDAERLQAFDRELKDISKSIDIRHAM